MPEEKVDPNWTPKLYKSGPQVNPNDPYTPTKGNHLASLAAGKGPATPRTPVTPGGPFQEAGLHHRYHIQVLHPLACCMRPGKGRHAQAEPPILEPKP